MEVMSLLFTMTLVVFIVSMMLAAGMSTTMAGLGRVFRNVPLVLLALAVNLVLVPLLGWGIAAMLSLATPAFIALVLIASSPGGPFATKLAVTQRGDVVTAGSLQVLMAALGSITFPITVSWILSTADLGENISIPVGRLMATVIVLQLVPFALGLAIRNWAPHVADGWLKTAMRVSNISFFAVLIGALLGGWQSIVDLVGSRALLAAIIFGVLSVVIGTTVGVGSFRARTTVGLMAPIRNAGPVFAAIGIAFANDAELLGTATGLILVSILIPTFLASFLARRRTASQEPVSEKEGVAAEGLIGDRPV